MKKTNYVITLFFIILLTNCSIIHKQRLKSTSKYIKLLSVNDAKTIQIENEYVKIYFNLNNVIKLIEIDNNNFNKKKIKTFLLSNFENKPFYLINNFKLKDSNEVILYHIIWKLLKDGKAKILYKKTQTFVKKIEFVKISDFSGKQEYFKIIDGDIFLTKIISVGE